MSARIRTSPRARIRTAAPGPKVGDPGGYMLAPVPGVTGVGGVGDLVAGRAVPRPRDGAVGDRGPVEPASTVKAWDALARARSDYDPLVLHTAESAVVEKYRELARRPTLPHGRVSDGLIPDGASMIRAAELGLRKAVRCWPRPDQLWGFEEFARGAIDTEIRQAARQPWSRGASPAAGDGGGGGPAASRAARRGDAPTRPQPVAVLPEPRTRLRLAVIAAGGVRRITVSGPVDLRGAADLAAALWDETAPGGQVLVDLSGVTFLAEAGLNALLDAHWRLTARAGALTLSGVNPHIRRLLQITGSDRLMHLEPVDIEPRPRGASPARTSQGTHGAKSSRTT